MRSYFLAVSCGMALSLMTGCAAGLQAEVGTAPPFSVPDTPDTVRVRILYTKTPSSLSSTGSYRFQLRKGGKMVAPTGTTRVRAMRSALVFGHQSFKGEVVAMPSGSSDTLKLNGRRYRGILVFHPLGSSRYDVVEYVNLEEYLYGVLPREVEPKWPIDALKAQAVVSRTYVLSSKLTATGQRFDVSNGVLDQVYGGQEAEAPESNRAVEESRGEVLLDQSGKPVQAFFHSSCGGMTELPQYVWKSSNAADVFGCVPDAFCNGDPHYKWQLTISYATIKARLRRGGIRVRDIKSIAIVQKSPSGRAEIFSLQTSKGAVEVWGNRFRLALGPEVLRSTLIVNMKAGKSMVSFEGRGWGHGVGLCQWGAQGRAQAGQTYKQILETYYPKAKLSKV